MQDNISIKGVVSVVLTDENNEIKYSLTKRNLITTAGKQWTATRIVSNANTYMTHVAIGSDNTAPSTGDTTLTAETARVAASTGSSGADATFTASFGAGVGTGTVAEAGILNNSSGGTLLSHVNGLSVTKGASDTLTITWTITVG